MAGTTGFEPATSDVTGRRSNQLNYVPALFVSDQNNISRLCLHEIAEALAKNPQRRKPLSPRLREQICNNPPRLVG